MAKKMLNKSSNRIDLIKTDDKYVTGGEEISEALAIQFVKNHSLTINDKHWIDSRVDKVVQTIDQISPSLLDNTQHHISVENLRKIISKLKIKKAPGIDGIPTS